MSDLYALDTEPSFIPCGGNSDDDGTEESCVEVAPLVGGGGAVELRDTKRRDRPGLRYTPDELDTFALAWIRDRQLTM